MYDVSDRLALINEWYLVTRRALEEQTEAAPETAP
jgi:hypothetical protein